jgi:hypothetical protein
MNISTYAGKSAEASMLVNVPGLVTAYYTEVPDPSVPAQRVAFGTSGHRGSSFEIAFNEGHILAISQAIGYPFFLRVLVYSEAGFYATIRKIFPKRNCRSGLQ